jgi:hypothetical protein
LLAHTLNSLSHEAVNFFKQMSHLTSSLAKTKGESPEKADAGMASAKSNPSDSATFLMLIAVTSVLLLMLGRLCPSAGKTPTTVLSRHFFQNKPCRAFGIFLFRLVLLARTGSPLG